MLSSSSAGQEIQIMTGQNPIAFSTGWLDEASGNLSQFSALTSRTTQASDTPLAIDIQHNIPVYDGHFVNEAAETPAARRRLLTEWTAVLAQGPGILVIKQGMFDHDVIDQATSLADSSTSLSEIENSAFASFKDLDDDFQKGSGEFSDKLLRVFEQCIRDSAPTISS